MNCVRYLTLKIVTNTHSKKRADPGATQTMKKSQHRLFNIFRSKLKKIWMREARTAINSLTPSNSESEELAGWLQYKYILKSSRFFVFEMRENRTARNSLIPSSSGSEKLAEMRETRSALHEFPGETRLTVYLRFDIHTIFRGPQSGELSYCGKRALKPQPGPRSGDS